MTYHIKILYLFQLLAVTITIFVLVNGRPQGNPAAPATPLASAPPNVSLVKNERKCLDDKGNYAYDIELSDGTKLIQMGNTEAPGAGEDESSVVIKGSYSYIAPDGTPVSITYIADKSKKDLGLV